MKKVYKYEVSMGEFCQFIPKNARILKVDMQCGRPMMWVLLDTDSTLVKRTFMTVATGERITFQGDHIGTFLAGDGVLVWHVFEVKV